MTKFEFQYFSSDARDDTRELHPQFRAKDALSVSLEIRTAQSRAEGILLFATFCSISR